MATYYTTVPPPGYGRYDYSSTSTSPSPDYTAPPRMKRHVRTASFTPPRVGVWQSPPSYGATPTYYTAAPRYASPPAAAAKYDYVSTPEMHHPPGKPRARRASASGGGGAYVVESIDINGKTKRRTSVRLPTQRIYVDAPDEVYGGSPQVHEIDPIYYNIEPKTAGGGGGGATRRSSPTKSKKNSPANQSHYFTQTTTYETIDTPTRSRARRSSTANQRPKVAIPSPKRSREPAVATAADAAAHDIPTGFVLKNWDPSERPVLLLGSVFDANSLGKWIYDWTVYHHNAGSPLAEVAGELWLLLIKFSLKMKRAEEGIERVRGRENRQMVSDFIESGNRLWRKLVNLLKVCEEFMWRVAKRSAKNGKTQMGEKSGVEFVKTIFGRDRELDETEKLMASVRLWNMRYEANCEELLRTRKY